MIIVDKRKMTAKVAKRAVVLMLIFLIMAAFGAIEAYMATSKIADSGLVFYEVLWLLISLHVLYYGIKEFVTIAKPYFKK